MGCRCPWGHQGGGKQEGAGGGKEGESWARLKSLQPDPPRSFLSMSYGTELVLP